MYCDCVCSLPRSTMSTCTNKGLSIVKLFIPLSFASMLGGTCTLIGTSTNLVVAGEFLHFLS